MEVHVVELRESPGALRGTVVSSEKFKSMKSAWKYFENDLLHHRKCPCTKVQEYSSFKVIQHWGDRYEPECKCSELMDEDFQKSKAEFDQWLKENPEFLEDLKKRGLK